MTNQDHTVSQGYAFAEFPVSKRVKQVRLVEPTLLCSSAVHGHDVRCLRKGVMVTSIYIRCRIDGDIQFEGKTHLLQLGDSSFVVRRRHGIMSD